MDCFTSLRYLQDYPTQNHVRAHTARIYTASQRGQIFRLHLYSRLQRLASIVYVDTASLVQTSPATTLEEECTKQGLITLAIFKLGQAMMLIVDKTVLQLQCVS